MDPRLRGGGEVSRSPPTRRRGVPRPRPSGGGACGAREAARARRRELAAQRPERIPAGTAFPARPLASPRFPGRAWVRGEEPGEGGERPSSRASREDPGELRRSAPGGLLSARSQVRFRLSRLPPSSPASFGLPSSPSAAAPALPPVAVSPGRPPPDTRSRPLSAWPDPARALLSPPWVSVPRCFSGRTRRIN